MQVIGLLFKFLDSEYSLSDYYYHFVIIYTLDSRNNKKEITILWRHMYRKKIYGRYLD